MSAVVYVSGFRSAARRSSAWAAYSAFISVPRYSRPCRWATRPVVPAPKNGSKTVAGIGSPPHSHDGSQPVVRGASYESHSDWPPIAFFDMPVVNSSPRLHPRAPYFVRSTTLPHGAPHCGQTPFSLVPARMHGVISFGGNVAKWLVFLVSMVYNSHRQEISDEELSTVWL